MRKCATYAPPVDGRTGAPPQPEAPATKSTVHVASTATATTQNPQTGPTNQPAATAQGKGEAPGYSPENI